MRERNSSIAPSGQAQAARFILPRGRCTALPLFVTFDCTSAVNQGLARAFSQLPGHAVRKFGSSRIGPQAKQVVHMKAFIRNGYPRIFAVLTALLLAFAQGGALAQGTPAFSQPQLDQMLAPIALYPDALLSQILMAATYPPEVLEAARWSRARPGLSSEDAVRAAADEDWDPSVKSLLAFPQVLARMGENPQWTQALGEAFLQQQSELMDSVQSLRRRAAAAGNLHSDDRLNVVEDGSNLLLQPVRSTSGLYTLLRPADRLRDVVVAGL